MYKKILHTIVEEHFEHPATLPPGIGQVLIECNTDGTGMNCKPMARSMSQDGLSPLPPVVINERTLVFRMDSRTTWTRYALGMINFSVSSFGNMPSTPAVEKNLSRNASAVGDYFIPYYGITAGTKIGVLLSILLINGTRIVEVIKDKKTDITVFVDIWARQIDDLADYLNELNPSHYPKPLLVEMITNLTGFWVDDFEARYKNDFAADAVALDNVLKVAVSGLPNHSSKGYSSLADILSRGLIAQFPLSFIE